MSVFVRCLFGSVLFVCLFVGFVFSVCFFFSCLCVFLCYCISVFVDLVSFFFILNNVILDVILDIL